MIGEFELPDLSAVEDSAEVAMLENVYVTCKQLESHLFTDQDGGTVRGIAGGEPPEVPDEIKELAKDIEEDQRLDLKGLKTRDPERKKLYDKVSQRKRDNPDLYSKAVAYIESQKPKV